MLRNLWNVSSPPISWSILNEVLSLNAQEYHPPDTCQERSTLLNEVLSLNAQECEAVRQARRSAGSSMKS